MKAQILLAGFAILTLLIGFSSGNNFMVYAEDADDRSQDDKERMEKYREEKQERIEKYIEEHKDKLTHSGDKIKDEYAKYKEEHKEKYAKYSDKIKAHHHDLKLKYDDLKSDFIIKYSDLRSELKDMLIDLTNARLTQAESSDLSELSEANILAFEEKRLQLQELKREFQEKLIEIKTDTRQTMEGVRQNYIEHEQERRDKIHDKLNDLKLKYKDRIKEHRTDHIQDKLTDYVEDKHVLICHNPPSDTDSAHSIRVSVNAVPDHLSHGDTMGSCDDFDINEIKDKVDTPVTDEELPDDTAEELPDDTAEELPDDDMNGTSGATGMTGVTGMSGVTGMTGENDNSS